jgi:formylmethanofuran dehydrogenase subunit E-like metal-binding protein
VATTVVDNLDAATEATTLVTGTKPVVVAGRVAEVTDWPYVNGIQAAMMYRGNVKEDMVLRVVIYHGWSDERKYR